MRILENWQSQMRSHLLQKMLKQLDVRRNPLPFGDAKSVGILFDATDSQTRDQIIAYVDQLKRSKPYTASIGYFDSKQDISVFSFKAFNKNDLDWLGRPKTDIIETYANRPFDYLICIYEDTCLPIEYLAALSNAHFRVGPYTENTYCYDLIIDTKDKGIKHYLKEVDFYLNKIIQTHEPQFIQRNRSSVSHSNEEGQG
jgi:hypothetical protein